MKLAFFDLESTGLSVSEDRIVEIAIIQCGADLHPTGDRIHTLIKPGRPIHPRASAVNGITDEMVADAPTFASIAPEVQAMCDESILAGQNIVGFDVPMLHFELVRNGQPGLTPQHPTIDTLAIEKALVKNNLSALHHRYCGETFDGAHRADVDVEATMRVLNAQVEFHKLDLFDLTKYTKSEGREFLDFSRKVYREPGDPHPRFAFGKFKDQIVLSNRETIAYARWVLGADFPADTKKVLKDLVK